MSFSEILSTKYSPQPGDALSTNLIIGSYVHSSSLCKKVCLFPLIYPLGMLTYSLSVVVRIVGLVKDTFMLIIATFGLLRMNEKGSHYFKEKLVVWGFSWAELGAGILGIFCPILANKADEEIQRYAVVRENNLFSLYGREKIWLKYNAAHEVKNNSNQNSESIFILGKFKNILPTGIFTDKSKSPLNELVLNHSEGTNLAHHIVALLWMNQYFDSKKDLLTKIDSNDEFLTKKATENELSLKERCEDILNNAALEKAWKNLRKSFSEHELIQAFLYTIVHLDSYKDEYSEDASVTNDPKIEKRIKNLAGQQKNDFEIVLKEINKLKGAFSTAPKQFHSKVFNLFK